jgi:1,4-alpha-glucan branching enzyme
MCITKRYTSNKAICKVTFILPQNYADKARKVHLVGEFNDWNTSDLRMKKVHGKFIRSLKLPANRKYQFRYLINESDWQNDFEADAITPVDAGKWYNSVIVV